MGNINIGHNIRKWFGTADIVLMAIITGWITYVMKTRDISVKCQIDSLPVFMQPVCFGKIMIAVAWRYMYITRNDFGIMRIIRQKSRELIWLKECRSIAVYTAVWSLAVIVLAAAVGFKVFAAGGLVNSAWLGEMPAIIFIKTYALCYGQLVCTLLFVALARWITNEYLPALIAAAAVGISDGHSTFAPVFYSRFTYSAAGWINDNEAAARTAAQLIFIAAVIVIAGYAAAGRKEFFGADNNSK